MKNYLLIDYDCDGIRDVVGVVRVTNDDEFDNKVVLACSTYYKKESAIKFKSGVFGESSLRLDIKIEDSEYLTYLNAEEVEIY